MPTQQIFKTISIFMDWRYGKRNFLELLTTTWSKNATPSSKPKSTTINRCINRQPSRFLPFLRWTRPSILLGGECSLLQIYWTVSLTPDIFCFKPRPSIANAHRLPQYHLPWSNERVVRQRRKVPTVTLSRVLCLLKWRDSPFVES